MKDSDTMESETSSHADGRVDRAFLQTIEYFSKLAHAREAGNGWGCQPIPNRTDLFNGLMGAIIRLSCFRHKKQHP